MNFHRQVQILCESQEILGIGIRFNEIRCIKADERNQYPNPSPFQTQDYENLSGELTWSPQRTAGGEDHQYPQEKGKGL